MIDKIDELYDLIVNELNLYDDYVSDNLVVYIHGLHVLIENAPMELKNSVAEELYKLIDEKKKYTAIWLYSYCVAIGDSVEILEAFLEFVLTCEKIKKNTRYFLYYQFKRIIFSNPAFDTVNTSVLKWKILEKVVAEFREELKDVLSPITGEKNENLVIVITEQMIGTEHGPTKTTFDRCKTLIDRMGKQLLLINTAEILSERGNVKFFDKRKGSYKEAFTLKDRFEWKGTQIPYFQCENNMPEINVVRELLLVIQQNKPGMVISIGGSSVVANLVNDIMPVLAVGLTPSAMEATMMAYQTLSRPLTLEDEEILKAMGIEKDSIIEGIFTSSLKEQMKSVSRTQIGISEDKFVVAIVGGRLAEEIDQRFLNMIKKLEGENIEVVCMGKYIKFEHVIEENPELKDYFRYLGFADDILSWLDNCDLYINPYRRGGGTSCAEALFKGLPVVTLPYGDVATNVGKDFWVDSYDEMAEMIKHYKNDKEFYDMMSEKAKKRAEILLDTEGEFVRIVEEFQKRARK